MLQDSQPLTLSFSLWSELIWPPAVMSMISKPSGGDDGWVHVPVVQEVPNNLEEAEDETIFERENPSLECFCFVSWSHGCGYCSSSDQGLNPDPWQ